MRRRAVSATVLMLCVWVCSCTASAASPARPTASDGGGAHPIATPIATGLLSQDCTDDANSPLVSTGWRLVWHHVFDQSIAKPPVIDGSQLVLIERRVPDWRNLKDTVLVIDPQSGTVLWKIVDAKQPVQFVSRKVIEAQASQKYWLFVIQYLKPDQLDTPNPVQYEVVVDRESGQVVYESGTLSDAAVTAISDEALFDRHNFAEMRRFDLPGGQHQWTHPWSEEWGSRGLFFIDSWLYYFRNDRNIYKYDSLTGALVMSATWGLPPRLGDVTVTGQVALGRSERGVAAFNLQEFQPIWYAEISDLPSKGSNAFWGNIPSMSATSNSAYLFDADDNLLRLDLLNGKTMWSVPSPGPQAMSRPVVVRDLVYALFADGTVRAFSAIDGSPTGIAAQTSIWYRKRSDVERQFLDLVGGLGVVDDTLIVTTGCRSVYAIQRAP